MKETSLKEMRENEKHLRCEVKNCVYEDCHYEINLVGREPCGRVEV